LHGETTSYYKTDDDKEIITIYYGVLDIARLEEVNDTLVTQFKNFTDANQYDSYKNNGPWRKVVLEHKGDGLVRPVFWNDSGTDFRLVDWSKESPEVLTAEEAAGRPAINFLLGWWAVNDYNPAEGTEGPTEAPSQ
jgi:hypothetical protein